jgi:hypothetical protein
VTTTSVSTPAAPAVARVSIAERVANALLATACVASALAFGAFAFVCARRIGYPYELEWMEGGTLAHVGRVLHGRAVYTTPTLAWTPNIYSPLYFWVSAAAAHVTGLNLATLRAVSVVSSVALAIFVWFTVRTETRGLIAPTIAVGLLFAMYRIGGSWFDVARVDMLFLALLFGAVLLARVTTRPSLAALTACVLVLAVLSKQAALVPALAVAPWMWTRGRRCFAAFAGTFALVGAGMLGWLQISTDGWFAYYVWTVPSRHAVEHSAALGFWTHDLFGKSAPAIVLAVVGLVLLSRESTRAIWLHAPFYAALIITSYSARLHTGGWDNVLLPVYVGTALLAGVGVGLLRSRAASPVRALAAGLAVLQFGLLAYQPTTLLPHRGSVVAGDRIVAELRTLPAPVLLTGEPWLLDRAGRPQEATAAASALQDVLRAGAGDPARNLTRELDTAVRAHRYCAIVVTEPTVFSALPASFATEYRFDRALDGARDVLPPTGYAIGPASIWVPAGPPTCGGR